jgi:hypothetical protein
MPGGVQGPRLAVAEGETSPPKSSRVGLVGGGARRPNTPACISTLSYSQRSSRWMRISAPVAFDTAPGPIT